MLTEPQHAFPNDEAVNSEQSLWADACLAIEIFSKLIVNSQPHLWPHIHVKTAAGPVRDLWLQHLKAYLPNQVVKNLPQGIDMHSLVGGLDITATLAKGKRVKQSGFLANCDGKILQIPLANNLADEVEAELVSVLDTRCVKLERDGLSEEFDARFAMIVLDEADETQNFLSNALTDRITLHIDLRHISYSTAQNFVEIKQKENQKVAFCGSEELEKICSITVAVGLTSMRPVMQTVKVAIAHASMNGREQVNAEDIASAFKLCLLNRAICIPENPSQDEADNEQNGQDKNEVNEPQQSNVEKVEKEKQNQSNSIDDLSDLDIEAIQTLLPKGMLEGLSSNTKLNKTVLSGGKSGLTDKSFKRGKPLASVAGKPNASNRLDLIATIRTAVPWQNVRRSNKSHTNPALRVQIRTQDFRIRKFKQQIESTTIFVVDASGSTALNRLGEAKGAIETLLSESYSRRDHVALIGIKGTQSEVLLAPTRSLVRAKRQLNMLRGGGGTPLAHGLQSAINLYEEEKQKGRIASLVILTDGSANISLAGKGGRAVASENVISIAKSIHALNIASLVVDINRLPNKRTREICEAMNGNYIAMPFVSSKNISDAVRNQKG